MSLKDNEFDDELILKRLSVAISTPVAYILNKCSFLGNNFYVDKNVLIPRNETEELVLLVKEYILNNKLESSKLCDIGTGSGCIAISLKKMFNSLNITAIDISRDALNVAIKNAKSLDVNINFSLSNCLDDVNNDFDIIVSNPPYIDRDTFVHHRVLNNEPHIALFADNKGLSICEKILKSASLNKNLKAIFFEISPEQISSLKELGEKYLSEFTFNIYKDMNGFDRFVSYIKN